MRLLLSVAPRAPESLDLVVVYPLDDTPSQLRQLPPTRPPSVAVYSVDQVQVCADP